MGDEPRMLQAIPVLPAASIADAIAFYEERLGFERAFEYPEHGGVRRGPVEIQFWRCEDPELPKLMTCRVNVAGIDALYEQCRAAGVVHPNGALEDKPWGLREFVALDVCGNGIVFAEGPR